MKLSIETYELSRRYGDQKAIKLAKEAGFDSIDYSYYWLNSTATEAVLGESYKEYAKTLRAYLDEIGITCNQAHAPFGVNPDEPLDLTSKGFLETVRAIESASILGADNIIVHSLNCPKETVKEKNLAFFRALEPYAKNAGIHISLENLFRGAESYYCLKNGSIVFDGLFGTPQEINSLLDELSDTFTLCVDLGHAAITRNNPSEFLRNIRTNRLHALHVQDTDFKGDRHFLPYTGLLNWNEISKAIADINYDGDLTLEVFKYLGGFDDELIPSALSFAHTIGRHIISKITTYKNA